MFGFRFRHFASIIAVLIFGVSYGAVCADEGYPLDNLCLSALGTRSGRVVILRVSDGKTLADAVNGDPSGKFKPGSVAKVITAYAGLKNGTITSKTVYECRNALKAGGRIRHCSLPGGHGKDDLSQALADSCSIWFYKAAPRIGKTAIGKTWEGFGIPPVRNWKQADLYSFSVGEQGIRTDARQLAGLARALAIRKSESDPAAAAVSHGMRLAVKQGTAKALDGLPATAAAKTGSPTHASDGEKRHGWVIGFAPYEKPEIAFAVFCMEGNAYRSAVPVAAEVLKGYFR